MCELVTVCPVSGISSAANRDFWCVLLTILLFLYMSIIMVVLSHYCCRTTLQCQCHDSQAKNSHNICPQLFSGNTRHVRESIHRETLPKQHSFQFLAEGDQSRRIPDMSRPRVPGSCCSRQESVVAQCCVVSTGPVDNRNEWARLNTIRSRYWNAFHCYSSRDF